MSGIMAAKASISLVEERENFLLRKGIEGYIVTHTWQTEREFSKAAQKANNGYPVWDYHTEEFAYTDKDDAIEKLDELVG